MVVLLAGCRDHLCDGAEPYCTDKVLSTCDDQHDDMHWETTTCKEFCIETSNRAFCASESAPRAACMGVKPGVVICDGAERVECLSDGFVKILNTCASADLCVPDLYLGCSALPGPQPECMARVASTDTPPWSPSFCRGNTAYYCSGDYAILPKTCSATQVCMQTAQYGACTPMAMDSACTQTGGDYPYRTCKNNAAIACLGNYLLPDFVLNCPGTCIPSGACQ